MDKTYATRLGKLEINVHLFNTIFAFGQRTPFEVEVQIYYYLRHNVVRKTCVGDKIFCDT